MPPATATLHPPKRFASAPSPLPHAPASLFPNDQRPHQTRNQISTNAHASAPLSRSKTGPRLLAFGSVCARGFHLPAAPFLPASLSVLVKRMTAEFGFSWAGFASLLTPVSFGLTGDSSCGSRGHCFPFLGEAKRVLGLRWAGAGVLRKAGQIVLVKSFSSPCTRVTAPAFAWPISDGLNGSGVCRA